MGGIESVITTGANTDGIWLRRAAIRVSHRILRNLLCLMTYQMTIWMCRRHDDFRSAAPIDEIAMHCTLPAHQRKWGRLSPVLKVGDLSPCPPPCPTPMIQPLVQWFLVLQEFGALQTSLLKHNRRLKQIKGHIATECSYRELGDRKSPSVVLGQSGGGLGGRSAPEAEGCVVGRVSPPHLTI